MVAMNPLLIQLFRDALDLEPSERNAYLDAQCSDPALRVQLDALLLAAEQTQPPLSGILPLDVSRPNHEAVDRSGELIGAFRLLSPLGHGGMGAVWLAERVSGFSQQVAIKWLHAGLSQSTRQRFARERETLAKLAHPGIARIVDGGRDGDAGADWFAMEYVAGLQLDAYTKSTQANLITRIQLVIALCDAVQYAHQNLIVHRDLKPANILVTADGQPKLLDFGVAKLLDDSHVTVSRAPMTFAYAAPEQIRGDAITTATDVYALGVILFELLTGERPHKPKGDGSLSLLQAITDTDATAPSHVVSLQTNTETTIRPKQLKGDLDTIVLKALSRAPARRYVSAQALSVDLQSYLDGHPISARKESVRYRFAKFVRRNRLATATTTIALVAVLAALAVSITQTRRANAQAARANFTNDRNIDLLSHLSGVLNRARGEGAQISVKQLMDWTAQPNISASDQSSTQSVLLKLAISDLLSNMSDHPRVIAVLDSIGPELVNAKWATQQGVHINRARSFLGLGRYSDAIAAIEAITKRKRQPDDVTAYAQAILSVIYQRQGNDQAAIAATLESVRIIRSLADGDPQTLGNTLGSAAVAMLNAAELEQAESLAQESLSIYSRAGLSDRTSIARQRTTLANVAFARGALTKARAQFAQIEPDQNGESRTRRATRQASEARLLALLGDAQKAVTLAQSARDEVCEIVSESGQDCTLVGLALADVALISSQLVTATQALDNVLPTQLNGVVDTNRFAQLRLRLALLSTPSMTTAQAYVDWVSRTPESGLELFNTRRQLLISAQQLWQDHQLDLAKLLVRQAIKITPKLSKSIPTQGGMDATLLAIWQAKIDGVPITPELRLQLAQAIGDTHPWLALLD
jgi:eukaryotic-like serine/threonine-protein kinase